MPASSVARSTRTVASVGKPTEPVLPVKTIDFSGVTYARPAAPNGGIAVSPTADLPRGTFTGDMLSAKAAAVRAHRDVDLAVIDRQIVEAGWYR
jgi:hypothetical protein